MSNTTTQISFNHVSKSIMGLWPRWNWIRETFTCVKWNISIARHFDQVFFNFHFELAFHNIHQGGYWFLINDMANCGNIPKWINLKVVKLWKYSFKILNKRKVHIIQWKLFWILFWLWLEVDNFHSHLYFYIICFLIIIILFHPIKFFFLNNLLQFIYYWFNIMLWKFKIILA